MTLSVTPRPEQPPALAREVTSHSTAYTNLSGPMAEAARTLHGWGANILPQRGKHPLSTWATWQDTRQTLADIQGMITSRTHKPAWTFADSIGIITGIGDWVAIDSDESPPETASSILAALGLDDDYPWQEHTTRGYHLYFRCPGVPLNGTGHLSRKGRDGGDVELKYRRALITLKPGRLIYGWPLFPPTTIAPDRLIAAYEAVTIPPPPKAPIPPARPYTAPATANGGDRAAKYAQAALQGALAEIKLAPQGHRNDILNHAAFRMGQLVGIGLLAENEAKSSLQCAGETRGLLPRDVAATITSGLEAGIKNPPDNLPDFDTDRRPSPSALPPTATRFPLGLPYTVNKRLINAHLRVNPHLKGEDRIKAQHPAALVWLIWHEAREIIPDDQAFSAGELQRASGQIGRNLTRHTIETGLEQLVAWGIVEICEFCNLPTEDKPCSKVAKVTNLQRTRPGQMFRFRPLSDQLANFTRHYTYLMRQAAFSDAPDKVQPEWADLTPDEIAVLDEIRAPMYEECTEERRAAMDKLTTGAGYLVAAVRRIEAGSYKTVILPPGALPNAAAYRRSLHLAGLKATGGEREEAYRAQFEIGVSRSELSRIRAANGVITLPREKKIPLDQVTQYQRDHLVLAEDTEAGTVTVKAAGAEKLVSQATPEELAAYKTLQEQQARRAFRSVSLRMPQHGEEKASRRDTIPPAYSEGHVVRQFEFSPGADRIPRFDQDSGEIFTGAQLWRLLLQKAANEGESQQAVAMGRLLEPIEKEAARERQGTRTDLQHSGNFPECYGRSHDAIGAAVGMSGKTYEKAKQVVEAADMDTDGNIESEPEKPVEVQDWIPRGHGLCSGCGKIVYLWWRDVDGGDWCTNCPPPSFANMHKQPALDNAPALEVDDLRQQYGGELALCVRHGKGDKQRLIPWGDLSWALLIVDKWLKAAGITEGPVFRGFYGNGRQDRVRPARYNATSKQMEGLTTRSVQEILAGYPIAIGGHQVTARNVALVAAKLGFVPWGGCDECPNLPSCHGRERYLVTLPCELDDHTAGINVYRLVRRGKAWQGVYGRLGEGIR